MSMWLKKLQTEVESLRARGGYSTDLIAFCRFVARMAGHIPHLQGRALGLAILEAFEDFGGYEPFERHNDVRPALEALGMLPEDLAEIRKRRKEDARKTRIAEKESA